MIGQFDKIRRYWTVYSPLAAQSHCIVCLYLITLTCEQQFSDLLEHVPFPCVDVAGIPLMEFGK